jgi:hypothetical protein
MRRSHAVAKAHFSPCTEPVATDVLQRARQMVSERGERVSKSLPFAQTLGAGRFFCVPFTREDCEMRAAELGHSRAPLRDDCAF